MTKAGARRRLVRALLLLAGTSAAREARAQREPLAADSVAIDVRVRADTAQVHARYFLARAVRAMDLTYLTNTCVDLSAIAAARNGAPVAFSIDTAAPWVNLHDTTETNDEQSALRYEVAYRVHLGRARRIAIPLVQPARALDARTAAVRAKVRIDVHGDRAPRFPRFSRTTDSQWTTTSIAIPATLVVDGQVREDATPCDEAIAMAGVNDGFSWRFAAFVGTLVLWIPLYFAWATRRQRRDDVDEGRA